MTAATHAAAVAPDRIATLQGVLAILLWGTLAASSTALTDVPPFQLVAMSFVLATLVGVGYAQVAGMPLAGLGRVPVGYWLLGVYGLLGYHTAYFVALRLAPAAEANLINYLWPLLIVLLTGLLPGRLGGGTLRVTHFVGAGLGLVATVLVITSRSGGLTIAADAAAGYLAALGAGLVWASYSVGSRLYAGVPSGAVIVTCGLAAAGAAALHLLLETTVWPRSMTAWAIVVFQGLGPVGIAFYLWDAGMKRGDIRLLGVLAYAAPVLSTALLGLTGQAEVGLSLWVAAGLVALGAAIASRPG